MPCAALGPLAVSSDNGTFNNDATVSDPLGNARTKTHTASVVAVTTFTYDPGTAILFKTTTANINTGHPDDTTTYSYDLAGSAWTTKVLKFAHVDIPGEVGHPAIYSRATTNNRYAADLKLLASVTHFDSIRMDTHGTWGPSTYEEIEEYRYDALGRRIWRRLVRPDLLCPLMDKASGCLSVVERTVWDGDQVLAEIRSDGGSAATTDQMECDANCQLARPSLEGRVLYTHGAGLDHPLDVIRLDWYNDVVVPVYSWRDRAVNGICVNSSQFCTDFTWPARTESATFEDPPVTDPVYGGPIAWAGNIMDTQKDGSGLVYKRNRYYDPASGRFTQVDPIGLGGGLNAYGFGGGDQVSYTDPFGLCPPKDTDVSTCNGGTTLDDAWKALDGAGSAGKAVIAGIVKNGLAVQTGGVGPGTACDGDTDHGCYGNKTITVNSSDDAGTMAVTISHEYAHSGEKQATSADGMAKNEEAAWLDSRKVYSKLKQPYKGQAKATYGQSFRNIEHDPRAAREYWRKKYQEKYDQQNPR